MRYGTKLAALALAAASAACATAEPAAPPPVTTRTVLLQPPCRTDGDAFACAREGEAERAARSGGRVRRDGDSLFLRVGDERAVVLADGGAGTAAVRYTYLQSLEGLGHYLVAVYDARGRGYALVSAASGRRESVAGPPVVSPDGRRFVAAAAEPDAGGVRGTLEVWRAEGGTLVREFVHRSDGWWADAPRWAGNGAVRFVRTAETPDGTSFRQTRAWLRRDGDAWRLDEGTL